MGDSDYRVLTFQGPGSSPRPALHLVREDAEASLCGIPRRSLDDSLYLEGFVCVDCIDWLTRRRTVSRAEHRVDPTSA
jgi:hypothetical protein